jgi:hypothetical protein
MTTLVPDAEQSKILAFATESDTRTAVFAPRQIEALAKVALARAPKTVEVLPPTWKTLAYRAYAGLADHVTRVRQDDGSPLENVVRFLIQDHYHMHYGDLVRGIHRLMSVLDWIPDTIDLRSDFNQIFQEETGTELTPSMCLAFALCGAYQSINLEDVDSVTSWAQFHPDHFLRKMGVDEEAILGFLDRMSLSQDYIEGLRKSDLQDMATREFLFDAGELRRSPLWYDGEVYLPVLAPAFRWRVTEGLYYDLLMAAGNQEKSKSSGFLQDFGHSFESYVTGLFRQAYPTSPFLEDRLHINLCDDDNSPEIDFLIEYDDALIVGEIKSARYHYMKSILAGDIDYIINKDLKKLLFEPAEQMSAAIDSLIEGELTVEGRRYENQKIYPLLVTYDPLPTLGPAWPQLLQKIDDNGHLNQDQVRPLVVANANEAVVLASLAAQGQSIRDFLELKISNFPDVSVQNAASEIYPRLNLNAVIREDGSLVTTECGEALQFEGMA